MQRLWKGANTALNDCGWSRACAWAANAIERQPSQLCSKVQLSQLLSGCGCLHRPSQQSKQARKNARRSHAQRPSDGLRAIRNHPSPPAGL
eukprot:3008934-Pleurochrysis_carterae.AAC.1